jgi:hypothetical protein
VTLASRLMPSRPRLALLACALVVALAAPAPAVAQLGGGGTSLGAPEQSDAAPPPAVEEGDGWEPWQTALVTLAGVVVLVGIAFAIVGDARRAAPATERDRPHRVSGPDGEVEDTRHQSSREAKARQRAKQKAARQARKRNRARR